MADQNMALDPGRQADPRPALAIVFAVFCIAIFYLTAFFHFYDGSAGALFSAIGGIFTGLGRADWGKFFNPLAWLLVLFPIMIAVRVIAWRGDEGSKSYAGNVFNDSSIRNFFFEMLLLGIIGFAFWFLVGNAVHNLAAANIASGFGFLRREAGFSINFSPFFTYSEISQYGVVYLVGLFNTLLVALFGIFFATVIGFLVGVARLSPNWILSRLAYVYVEVMRNIPLLLWIFIWYFSVLRLLPDKATPINLGPLGLLNIAGYYAPLPILSEGAGWIGFAFLGALLLTWFIAQWARARQMATGQQFPVFRVGLGLIIGLPLLAHILNGFPITFEYATASRFGPRGGARLPPEFLGLLVALTTYTSAYIAEIVRAGILAINKGQTEASFALGLRPGPALRLVVIPQAMRVIIPPMTNQYLNLTKNSSLAVAIAYPELVSVFAGTALNQTGQAVEILMMTMLTYLALSLLTSLFMNWFNAKMALVER